MAKLTCQVCRDPTKAVTHQVTTKPGQKDHHGLMRSEGRAQVWLFACDDCAAKRPDNEKRRI